MLKTIATYALMSGKKYSLSQTFVKHCGSPLLFFSLCHLDPEMQQSICIACFMMLLMIIHHDIMEPGCWALGGTLLNKRATEGFGVHSLQQIPHGLSQDRNCDKCVRSVMLVEMITMCETQLFDELKGSTKKCSQGR